MTDEMKSPDINSKGLPRLLKLFEKSSNIAEALKEEVLEKIGKEVCEGYRIDRQSRDNWEKTAIKALKFAKQIKRPKNTPFQNASNVIIPLISLASISFAARVYPEVIKDNKVVQIGVQGMDPTGEKAKKAENVKQHMTYQLLKKSDTWEPDMDKMLSMLAIVGTCFKKAYYDPIDKTVNSELCNPQDVVIHHFSPSIEKADRITHRYFFNKNDIVSRVRSGIFRNIDLDEDLEKVRYGEGSIEWDTDPDNKIEEEISKDAHYEILEQHCKLDLDKDGYEEPYIVIVNKQTQTVLGIYPRFDLHQDITADADGLIISIKPQVYFTDYHFLRNPDGGFYSIGFGHLLYPLNAAANSLLNQLIDKGTLGNTVGGLIGRQLRLKGGNLKHKFGEFLPVDVGTTGKISDSFHVFNFGEPSPVTFQLLSLLISMVKEVASINEIMTGDALPQNAPAQSVMELSANGLKLFSSIAKRLHRSLKKEFQLVFFLNNQYMDNEEYIRFLDDPQANVKNDYDLSNLDIMPVADPTMSSDTLKSAQLNMLVQLLQQPILAQTLNPQAFMVKALEHLDMPMNEIQSILAPPPDPNAPPPPEVMKVQLEAQKIQNDAENDKLENQIRRMELQVKLLDVQNKYKLKEAEAGAKIEKMRADAMKDRETAHQMDRKLDIEEDKVEVMKRKNTSE